jgi:hypothetical protein
MFQNERLFNYLKNSPTVKSKALIIGEWNLNIAENIAYIGNYRYRPAERLQLNVEDQSLYASLNNIFDYNDDGNFYTGATEANTLIDGGLNDDNTPAAFLTKNEKESLLYSLEDCLGKFRPRSGINKLRYFDGNYSHHTNIDMASRPRYYMAHREDSFKYWTSYRTEDGQERGVANQLIDDVYYIDDAVPFVVYNNPVPANKIVVKMQTNIGSVNLGPFSDTGGQFSDPLFGQENSTIPIRWSIEALIGNSWTELIKFNEDSFRTNELPVVGPDGYVEIAYGLNIPEQFRESFVLYGDILSESQLPQIANNGQAYFLKDPMGGPGTFYVWSDDSFSSFQESYSWSLFEEEIRNDINLAKDLVSPKKFISPLDGSDIYKEFQYISGIRIVVEAMRKADATFDLIEMSPRLSANLTDRTLRYSLEKQASDLGNAGMPVGQLLAGTGSVDIFDYDLSFSRTNRESIISSFLHQSFQVKFYDVITEVADPQFLGADPLLFDYYIPIKTMYSDGFPEIDNAERLVSIPLRDKYFYFEFMTAPQLAITNASLSYAVSSLLDYVGFSNYVFKRLPGESDPIIPLFFIPPNRSVAEILQDLAISTQSAMFFDEFNNLVIMSKNYMLPDEEERGTDFVLRGSKDSERQGIQRNRQITEEISDIIAITSQENSVFNDGSISYETKYIQKNYGTLDEQSRLNTEKNWTYKSVLLWEIAPEDNPRSENDEITQSQGYALAAIPLNSDLTDDIPIVQNNQVINNVIDLGEGVVLGLGRYNGYFYANGEIIRYDAVEYSIPGLALGENPINESNVWISSVREYQNYFSKIPFNGKMYPTGLVRIFSEPNYETIGDITQLKNGPVAKHGRGQFGTQIVNHSAGLDPYWSSNENVRGCKMSSDFLFKATDYEGVQELGKAGISNDTAIRTFRNGIINNFMSVNHPKEVDTNRLMSTETGTIQSSAFVITGANFFSSENPIDYISYVYKPLDNNFKHFGSRMRIVGKLEDDQNRTQTPNGVLSYYTVENNSPDKSLSIGGSSGGIGVMLNPETNVGYYLELVALTDSSLDALDENSIINDVIFYKIVENDSNAIPVKLWGGLMGVAVDDGRFTGQHRRVGEEVPSVYDIAVEYEDVATARRFYLYINNTLVQIVDDPNPLPVYNNMAMFVRGASRCMFENLYAITSNYSQNTGTEINLPSDSVFSKSPIAMNEAFNKYALSGMIQSSYLSGISPAEPPAYNMYFEEFGTIMREASYINVKYDKAFPALYALLTPTVNNVRGYTVSGFIAGAYGAEFLIFNTTDTTLSLGEDGNYLTIQGVAFTQSSQNELTVDEYFSKTGSFSDPEIYNGKLVSSPIKQDKIYRDIKSSRITHGRNDFSLNAVYLQSQDEANEMMKWFVSKIMKPRLSIGLDVFANPMIQLGDIVEIDYKEADGDSVVSSDSRFVVYHIEQSRGVDGPEMTLYVSEVS